MPFSVHLMIMQLKSLEWKLRNASDGLVTWLFFLCNVNIYMVVFELYSDTVALSASEPYWVLACCAPGYAA
jgi:hypothetical protein